MSNLDQKYLSALQLGLRCGMLTQDGSNPGHIHDEMAAHLRVPSFGMDRPPQELTGDEVAYLTALEDLRADLRTTEDTGGAVDVSPAPPHQGGASNEAGEMFEVRLRSTLLPFLAHMGLVTRDTEAGRAPGAFSILELPFSVEAGAVVSTETQQQIVREVIAPLMWLCGIEGIQLTPAVPDYRTGEHFTVSPDTDSYEDLRVAWLRFVYDRLQVFQ